MNANIYSFYKIKYVTGGLKKKVYRIYSIEKKIHQRPNASVNAFNVLNDITSLPVMHIFWLHRTQNHNPKMYQQRSKLKNDQDTASGEHNQGIREMG